MHLLKALATLEPPGSCMANETMSSFRIDLELAGTDGVIVLFGDNSEKMCREDLSYNDGITNLLYTILNGIAFDFGAAFAWESAIYVPEQAKDYSTRNGSGTLATLPGLTYPCTSDQMVWAPWSTILLDLYTVVAATFPPLLLIVTFLLRFIEPKDGLNTSQEDVEADASSALPTTYKGGDGVSIRSPRSPLSNRESDVWLGVNHLPKDDPAEESFALIARSLAT